jgi:adenylate cyclase
MSEERASRKLSGILSADAVGYSRLMQRDESSTIRTLEDSKKLICEIIEQLNGRVVDAPGDNLLAEFGSVLDATECAVKIQEELKAKNEELPVNRKMDFRIGVNLGDVVEESGRIYGDGVNIAARIESLADAGGVCISGNVYDQIGKKLPFGYEYLGEQRVKNIEKPVRVYRVLMDPEAVGKVIGEKKFLSNISRKTATAVIIVLVIIAGGLVGWNIYLQQSKKLEPASSDKMAYPLPDKPSIAVLPFDNFSGDPEQEYFSDGLTEEIITALSTSTQIFVIARNSTFIYKGKPVKVQQVAEDLGIRYVLEGSVRKDADRVRITAQLIDAIKGIHLWAERYDSELKDIFSIQDRITKKIISALHTKLTMGEDARLVEKGTNSLEAYLKFLQAREYLNRDTKEDNLISRKLCEEAISIDREFASAYVLLGATHMSDVFLQNTKSPRESLGKAIELTKKAISLGAKAQALLGWLYVLVKQHDKGVIECQKAVELLPGSAYSRTFYGLALNSVGRFEEAVHELKQAVRLDPLSSSVVLRSLAYASSLAGHHEQAIAAGKKAVKKGPNDIVAHLILLFVYDSAGNPEQAQSEAAEVLRLNPKFSTEEFEKRLSLKYQADKDRVIDAFRRAGLK